MSKIIEYLIQRKYDFMKKIKGLNIEEVKKAKTLKQFNEAYTIKVHGFKTSDEFNQVSSCDQHIPKIKIPVLALNAKDDPFVNPKLLGHFGNPNVITVGTGLFFLSKNEECGGHVAFLEGLNPFDSDWTIGVMDEYFEHFLE
jgi:uncharacterized protein